MSVPFIDLQRTEKEGNFLEAWGAKVLELSKSNTFIGGSEVKKLEETLIQDCQAKFAFACGNGTDALQIALRAVGVGPGDIVLLPDFTFWATFEAIVNVGATPITVDIHPNDLQMDYDLFCQAAKAYRPKAAILVHLYGWGSECLKEYRNFCKENEITLIEDGAQVYGTGYEGQSIYQEAEISTISFYPAKVFGGAGDGGAVLSSDQSLVTKIAMLGNHGRDDHYSHELSGWNSRLNSLQAAYLNLVHSHLAKRIESRVNAAQIYRQAFTGQSNFRCVEAAPGFTENGYLSALVFSNQEKRANCITALKAHNIGFGITYPKSISEQRGAQPYLKQRIGNHNHAVKISQTMLNPPLFAYITKEEVEQVISVITAATIYRQPSLSS